MWVVVFSFSSCPFGVPERCLRAAWGSEDKKGAK
jgi:hypothetical protein